MPHLSPMSWTMMFIGSWIIILLMSINISYQKPTLTTKMHYSAKLNKTEDDIQDN